jgi:hypothetical protein
MEVGRQQFRMDFGKMKNILTFCGPIPGHMERSS